jgi:hypothetical protein
LSEGKIEQKLVSNKAVEGDSATNARAKLKEVIHDTDT